MSTRGMGSTYGGLVYNEADVGCCKILSTNPHDLANIGILGIKVSRNGEAESW